MHKFMINFVIFDKQMAVLLWYRIYIDFVNAKTNKKKIIDNARGVEI